VLEKSYVDRSEARQSRLNKAEYAKEEADARTHQRPLKHCRNDHWGLQYSNRRPCWQWDETKPADAQNYHQGGEYPAYNYFSYSVNHDAFPFCHKTN
jgi:hypothetical protein